MFFELTSSESWRWLKIAVPRPILYSEPRRVVTLIM